MTKVYEKRDPTIEVIADVICNLCGESCREEGNIEALHCEETWGYGSGKDCTRWSLDLCAKCSNLFNNWLTSLGGHVDVEDYCV